jgi:hypothetical protein
METLNIIGLQIFSNWFVVGWGIIFSFMRFLLDIYSSGNFNFQPFNFFLSSLTVWSINKWVVEISRDLHYWWTNILIFRKFKRLNLPTFIILRTKMFIYLKVLYICFHYCSYGSCLQFVWTKFVRKGVGRKTFNLIWLPCIWLKLICQF